MPFIQLKNTIPGVSVGVWKIEEPEIYFLERIKLYENEWARLAEIKHPQKRLEWLSSRLCMKEILKIANHMRVESLNGKNGKPYLTNNSHNISYTHSTRYSAAIASLNGEVGIDIEYLGHKRNTQTRFLFMGESELEFYNNHPQMDIFLLIWSIKETVYKLFGQGIAFKHNILIDFRNFLTGPNGILSVDVKKDDLHKQYEVHYAIHSEFLLTYVCDFLPSLESGGNRQPCAEH
ncbi:MAG: 4'-phosphopantetheinyl transferase superfamily protein [Bacteroidia bacterium]|nr:4'-phosphopantetheinyl transferase superfamily protein [Bacteroidia bacterium]